MLILVLAEVLVFLSEEAVKLEFWKLGNYGNNSKNGELGLVQRSKASVCYGSGRGIVGIYGNDRCIKGQHACKQSYTKLIGASTTCKTCIYSRVHCERLACVLVQLRRSYRSSAPPPPPDRVWRTSCETQLFLHRVEEGVQGYNVQ